MQAGMHGVTFLIVRNMINNVPFRLQNQIHAQLYESCLFQLHEKLSFPFKQCKKISFQMTIVSHIS